MRKLITFTRVFLIIAIFIPMLFAPTLNAGPYWENGGATVENLPLSSLHWNSRWGITEYDYWEENYWFNVECPDQQYAIKCEISWGYPTRFRLRHSQNIIDELIVSAGESKYFTGNFEETGIYWINIGTLDPQVTAGYYISNDFPINCAANLLNNNQQFIDFLMFDPSWLDWEIYHCQASNTYTVEINGESDYILIDNYGYGELYATFYEDKWDFEDPLVDVYGEYLEDLIIDVSGYAPGTYYCEVGILGELDPPTEYLIDIVTHCDPEDEIPNDPCDNARPIDNIDSLYECVDHSDDDWYVFTCPYGLEAAAIEVHELSGDVKAYVYDDCDFSPIAESEEFGGVEYINLGYIDDTDFYIEVVHTTDSSSDHSEYHLILTSICGGCAPEGVPNDPCDYALEVDDGAFLPGCLDESDLEDWYHFYCPAGLESAQIVANDYNGILKMRAYSYCGFTWFAESYESGSQKILDLSGEDYDDYWIQVFRNNDSWVEYTILFNYTCVDYSCDEETVPNDPCSQAMVVPYSGWMAGDCVDANDDDWYEFSCASGLLSGHIEVAEETGDVKIKVYKSCSDSLPIAISYDTGNYEKLDLTDLPWNNYFIKVETVEDEVSEYSIEVNWVCDGCPDDPEPNDFCNEAVTIESGFNEWGCVEDNYDDEDWFVFECSEGIDGGTVHVDTLYGNPNLKIFDSCFSYPSNPLYTSNNPWGEDETIILPAEEYSSYYILIYEGDGLTATYELSIDYSCAGMTQCEEDPEPNDQCYLSVEVMDDDLVDGCVDINDTEDWYKVICPYGFYELQYRLYVHSGNADLFGYLECGGGYYQSSTNPGTQTEELGFDNIENTVYYIRVRQAMGEPLTSDYTLEVEINCESGNCDPDPVTNDPCPDAYSVGDAFETDGCVYKFGDDEDWYVFNCEYAVDEVVIDLAVNTGNSDLYLYSDCDDFPYDFIASSIKTGSQDENITLTDLDPGDYYILVHPNTTCDTTSEYHLSIDLSCDNNVCDPDPVPNDLCTQAVTVNDGNKYGGCVGPDDSEDWYMFSCPYGLADTILSLEVDGGDADMYVFTDCSDYPDNPLAWSANPGGNEHIYLNSTPYVNYYILIRQNHTEHLKSPYILIVEFACGTKNCGENPYGNTSCENSLWVQDGFTSFGCVDQGSMDNWYEFQCPYGLESASIAMDLLTGNADLFVYIDCDDYPNGYIASSVNPGTDSELINLGTLAQTSYFVMVLQDSGTGDKSQFDLSIDFTCENPCPEPGDLDGDGCVDANDIIPVGLYWDCKDTQGCWDSDAEQADCAGHQDGEINSDDIINIGIHWHDGC